VYFTQAITPQTVVRVYEALGHPATGKVGIKISTGEPGPRGGNWLDPQLIRELVELVAGTLVETNMAYPGRRTTTEEHLQVAAEHGYTAIAPVDILDADGSIELPVRPGGHLSRDIVGSHLRNYDHLIVLSHFKGHAMSGFGGAIKNLAVGLASPVGKVNIYSAGRSTSHWSGTDQNDFLESVAEAAVAVTDFVGHHILYLNIVNNLSVDCDCNGDAAPATMADIGVLGSLDPVALDQATIDLVWQAPDSDDLKERIESRNGRYVLEQTEQMGLGSRQYDLVRLD
jgi:uncharacterized Fe-S center protein